MDIVKHYYGLLWQVYLIVISEIPDIKPDLALLMFFKAINNSVDPHELVLTLPVFGIYPRMTELNALSSSISQRAMAIIKAMDKNQKYITFRQVNNAVKTCNELSTISIYDLSINSSILVYQKQNASPLGK